MELMKYYQRELDRIRSNTSEYAKEALLKNQGLVVSLLKYNQLSRGLNPDGGPLSFEQTIGGKEVKGKGKYSGATQAFADRDGVSIPKEKGAPYNFSWTGETLDNLKLGKVKTSDFTYSFKTVSAKQKLLEKLYGEIFELSEEHNEYVNKEIIEPYVAWRIIQEINKMI